MTPDIIIPTCKSIADVAAQLCDISTFSHGCRIFATCSPLSAAANRNIGLEWAKSDVIIQVDDDISGFYLGWWEDLLAPLQDPENMLVSARLVKESGSPAEMNESKYDLTGELEVVPHVPTAACAWRPCGVQFDERFQKSGFEDTWFCEQMRRVNLGGRIVINNKCKLIHANEAKGQSEAFKHNQALFSDLMAGRVK